jgi:hypothetical protein
MVQGLGQAICQPANEGWLCDLNILAAKRIPACIAAVAISASYEIVAVLDHLLGMELLRSPVSSRSAVACCSSTRIERAAFTSSSESAEKSLDLGDNATNHLFGDLRIHWQA